MSIFAIVALSLNVLTGAAGIVSLATGAFFGLGAYTTAILCKAGAPSLVAQLTGVAIAAVLSAVIALPALRVRGVFLLLVTIAVQIIFTVVAQSWISVTGGDAGISRIPPYSPFGVPLRGVSFLLVCVVMVIAMYIFCRFLMSSPFGAVLRGLRDDETGCAALGKHVGAAKVTAFAVSGGGAAFAGSLYAHYTAFVDPFSFDLSVSILMFLIVVLGGAGTANGPLLGVLILTLLPEVFKFLPLPPGVAAAVRQLLYGVLLVAVMYFRPQGILSAGPVGRPMGALRT